MLSLVVITLLSMLGFFDISSAQEPSKLLTLEEAYCLAIKSHERIMIAEKEIEKSRLLPKKVMTMMIPHIYFDGDYTRLDDEITHTTETNVAGPYGEGTITIGPIPAVPKRQRIANLEVKQSIYEWSFFPRRRQAFCTIDSSVESYYQTVQDILFQVASVYYRLVQTKEMLRNAKEILKLAEEELRVSRVRLMAGKVTEDVILKSELSVARAQRKIIENSNNLQLAKGNLTRLIGIQLEGYAVAAPPTSPMPGENYETLVSKALEHRHDYKLAHLKVELAEVDVELVKARFHPTIDGAWNYYRVHEETYARDKRYWAASLQIKVPIFEGSLRIWDLKEKLTGLRQARLVLDDLKKDIQIEVEGSILEVKTYESILSNLRKQVELSEKNYEIIFSQFKFGSATSLDLDEARARLGSARTELITNTYDHQLAVLTLQKSIGLFAVDYTRGANQNN